MNSNYIKISVVLDEDIKDRKHTVDETNWQYGSNFGPGTVVLGIDGKAYQNYGSEENPVWDEIFDANYKVLINPVNL